MTAFFWTCLALVAYVYVGYPAMLRVWAWLGARPYAADARPAPTIAIVMAARNEGARLAARIDNLLDLDYPPIAGKSSSSPTAAQTTRSTCWRATAASWTR